MWNGASLLTLRLTHAAMPDILRSFTGCHELLGCQKTLAARLV